MEKIMIFFLLLLLVSSTELNDEEKEKIIFNSFQNFIKLYNVTYSSNDEFQARLAVFKDNYLRLESDMQTNKINYNSGVTRFFDMTGQEFARKYLNLDLNLNDIVAAQKLKGSLIDNIDLDPEVRFNDLALLPNSTSIDSEKSTNINHLPGRALQNTTELPENFDWRTKGVVSPVRNQATCGSCWSFSTITVLEARYALKYGKLQNLSEQHLINCVTTCNGCFGGTVGSALKFLVHYSNGVVSESSLPYATTQFNCNVNYMTAVVEVTDWATAGTQDEERIKKMLFKYGPLSVALNAKYLQYYRGGIIDVSSKNCNPFNLNHAVNLVGWGVEDGKEFWIVRNTWGPYWGENGYFRIARGKGTCGINKYVLTAFVK